MALRAWTILNAESYGYDLGNEPTQQTFTVGNYVNYTCDNLGQPRTATGQEAGGTPSRLHEQMGYGYGAGHNLNWRTNNALVESFTVNSQNEVTNVARAGTLTVAGTTTIPATSVTVNGLAAGH